MTEKKKSKRSTLTYEGSAAEVENQGQVFERNKAVDVTGREDQFAKLFGNPLFKGVRA